MWVHFEPVVSILQGKSRILELWNVLNKKKKEIKKLNTAVAFQLQQGISIVRHSREHWKVDKKANFNRSRV